MLDLGLPQKKNQSRRQDETLSLAEVPPKKKVQGKKYTFLFFQLQSWLLVIMQ